MMCPSSAGLIPGDSGIAHPQTHNEQRWRNKAVPDSICVPSGPFNHPDLFLLFAGGLVFQSLLDFFSNLKLYPTLG